MFWHNDGYWGIIALQTLMGTFTSHSPVKFTFMGLHLQIINFPRFIMEPLLGIETALGFGFFMRFLWLHWHQHLLGVTSAKEKRVTTPGVLV